MVAAPPRKKAGKITPAQHQAYWKARHEGETIKASARHAGFSESTAHSIERSERQFHLNELLVVGSPEAPFPRSMGELPPEARRALITFAYFQRRYFGRIAIPWQVEAAEKMVTLLESPEEEYTVVNASPGAGKSTLFTLDFAAWVTCRDRSVRGQIGSLTLRQAQLYVMRLRRALESTLPAKAEINTLRLGLAVDAEATLAMDFGRFKPENKDVWSFTQFVVMQGTGKAITEKEPTWSAFGKDSAFLGGRYDLVIWDDLTDPSKIKTSEARDQLKEWYGDIAETRLEPGGLMILQGQRTGADDIYRHALDMTAVEFDDEGEEIEASEAKKYSHLIFRAHYETRCKGAETHKRSAKPYPDGCLLYPRRLTWQKLATIMANREDRFLVLYQQEDADPEDALVHKDWIFGTSEFPGCLDREREFRQVPPGLGPCMSVVTCDPSPSNRWGIIWWLVEPVTDTRYVMDIFNGKMEATGLLDYDRASNSYTGLMAEWQRCSMDLGIPITTWIVEYNGAQKFLLQYQHARDWQQMTRVTILSHTCVDPETEVLSTRGWLNYSDLQVGDTILTLNIETEMAEWKPVLEVYASLYEGPMHRFSSRSIDALCTLDHKWPRSGQAHGPMKLVESQHLNTNSVLPVARPLGDDWEPTVSDDFVELVGWAVTEGHFKSVGTGIAIGQSPTVNPLNCERIRSLLKRLDAHWTERPNDAKRADYVIVFTVTGPLALAVRQVTGHAKHLPPGWIASLPRSQRELLREVLTISDGWWTKSGTAAFVSTSESLATAFEMLHALTGIGTRRRIRTDGPDHWQPRVEVNAKMGNPRLGRVRPYRDIYLQNVSNRPQVVDYRGVIWCPRTVNGTFYARRGGLTYFTGNTGKNKATPEFGVQSIRTGYRTGRYRLPWKGVSVAGTRRLIDELTRYGQMRTDDLVMSNWFLEWNMRKLQPSRRRGIKALRPSWL